MYGRAASVDVSGKYEGEHETSSTYLLSAASRVKGMTVKEPWSDRVGIPRPHRQSA